MCGAPLHIFPPRSYRCSTMLGYDGIWFGVVMIFVMNMGLLTPPLGLSVYIISGIVKDVPIQRIFKGVTPMLLTIILCLALIVIFPEIVTFLPDLMR